MQAASGRKSMRATDDMEQRPQPGFINQIKVAAQCNADWNNMRGDDNVRLCLLCSKNVYDLSKLSQAQAEALILEKEGKLCVQFYRRIDGTVVVDNCPVGLRKIRDRLKHWYALAAALFAAFIPANLQAQEMKPGPGAFERGEVYLPPEKIVGQPANTGVCSSGIGSNKPPDSAHPKFLIKMSAQIDDIAAADSGMFVDVDKAVRGMMASKKFKLEHPPRAAAGLQQIRTPNPQNWQGSWQEWYTNTSTRLFNCWKSAPAAPGQMTIMLTATPEHGLSATDYGAYFSDTATQTNTATYAAAQEQFRTAVDAAISSMNRGQPLFDAKTAAARKVTFQVTFGYDKDRFPRHDAQGFGMFAKLNDKGDLEITPASSQDAQLRNVSAHNHGVIITTTGNLNIGPGTSITVEDK
jgi:hypothetical protein